MNLGTARIVIIVALVVTGVVVLANGFPETGSSGAGPSGGVRPSGTSTPTTTGSPTPPPATPSPQVQGVTVMALNGTSVSGAAAAAQDQLTKAGYSTPAAPADAPTQGVQQTVVYYRADTAADQNKSDATHLAKKNFPGAPVKKLDQTFQDVVPPSVSIVVVVGADFADSLASPSP